MSTKIYLSNTCYKNEKILNCSTFKITVNADYFVVKKYGNFGNNTIIVVQKNFLFTYKWISYSPISGLFLNNICVGENIFNLDEDSYFKMQSISFPTLFKKLHENNFDRIEQVTSDQKIKLVGDKINLYGNSEMHSISKTNDGTFTCGAFSNLMNFLQYTPVTSPININIGTIFEGDSKCHTSGVDNITFTYLHGKPSG